MINKELMKKKLESLRTNGKSDKKDNTFFKPEEGDQDVRFLPSPDGDPFKEYHFHYGLGDSFLCPKRNFNEKCAVCEFASALWKEGTPESQKQAKGLFARQRFFTNVLVRDKDGTFSQPPKPYGYGKETYEQLIETSLDPDYDDFTDPEQGRDFKLNYKKADKQGAYPKTKLTIKAKQSSIGKAKKEIKEILDKAQPIESYLTRKSSQEVQAILDKANSEPLKDEKRLGEATAELPSDSLDSVDDAIDELRS
jgi:hypothetical protein